MRKLSREEKYKAQDSFAFIETPTLPTRDRSTLERWATCPWQAKAVENGMGRVMPAIVESGEQIHQALGRVTRWYIEEASSVVTRSAIVQELEVEIRQSRPDLTMEAVAGLRASIWSWASFINEINPVNILGFDGGEEVNRSGQLSHEFGGAMLTSELDLLYAGPSPQLLHEVDYKTGHGVHTSADVAASFQFQFHAALVFWNFPEVNGLEVTVWNTRTNNRTFCVVFHRKQLPDIEARINSAMATQWQHGNDDSPPTWPLQEKCAFCPVAFHCPAADEPLKDIASEGGEQRIVDLLVATEARAEAIRKLLTDYADAQGRELVGSGTARFGRQKPKAERRASAALYNVKDKE